ncbi:MAG: hypothetical protein D6741_07295 [Planctomycetota bacterium]|nr:MAG: hypothetical protein D6741_07295 [Planctomycetota bacterium]
MAAVPAARGSGRFGVALFGDLPFNGSDAVANAARKTVLVDADAWWECCRERDLAARRIDLLFNFREQGGSGLQRMPAP